MEQTRKAGFRLRCLDYLHNAAEKRFLNASIFHEIARRYDFITRALSFGRDGAWKRALVKSLPALEHPSCLDIACGTGDLTLELSARYPSGKVIGLDLTPAMLVIAKKRLGEGRCLLTQQDMTKTSFADESFDIVTGGYALRNAPVLSHAVKEIERVLKPGGCALFLDFSKPAQPGLQKIEYWLLRLWGSFWGLLLHGTPEVYRYIAESLRRHPDRPQLHAIMQAHGLTVVRSKLFFFGVIELLVCRKEAQ